MTFEDSNAYEFLEAAKTFDLKFETAIILSYVWNQNGNSIGVLPALYVLYSAIPIR